MDPRRHLSRNRPAFLLSLIALGVGLPGCLVEKREGASAVDTTTNFSAIFTNAQTLSCAPSLTFQRFSASFYNHCIACHSSGGSGSGKLLLESGTDDISLSKNYVTTLSQLVSSTDTTAGEPTTERMLKYPLGFNHASILTPSDAVVTQAADWMYEEWNNDIDTPCTVVRPGIGLVQ